MRRLAVVTVALLVVVPGFGACSRARRPAPLRLDGSPRVPDDEGVATALSFDRITLDGKRTYKVSRDLRAFSTYTLALEPMLGRKGQYVQVGLDGDTMIWMAGVARILVEEGRPVVYYRGRFLRRVDRRLVFEDGTTFAVAPSVSAPAKPREVTVRIDARTHRVDEVR